MRNLSEYLIENTIVEMANSKSEFEKLVYNLFEQIIENWCLVKLCDLYPQESFSINRNHWCSELKSYIMRIYNKKLKTGKKINIIYDLFIKEDEYNDSIRVAELIRDKFNKENLQKYINIISGECANNINRLCNILSENDIDNINTYLQEPIGQ